MESPTPRVTCTAAGDQVRGCKVRAGIVSWDLLSVAAHVLLLLYPCGLLQHLGVWPDSSTFSKTQNIQSQHCLCYSLLIPLAGASVPELTHQVNTPALPQGEICQFNSKHFISAVSRC